MLAPAVRLLLVPSPNDHFPVRPLPLLLSVKVIMDGALQSMPKSVVKSAVGLGLTRM